MNAAISAAGAILSYVQDTQMQDTKHIFQITPYDLKSFLVIDDRSCKNLELLVNIQTLDKKGSLIHVLDRTVTAMGSRLIKHWIRYPLIDKEKIRQRLDCIEEITRASHIHQLIINHLKSVYDLERLGSKISMGQGNARDLIALKNSLKKLPLLFKELSLFKSSLLNGKDLEDQERLLKELELLAGLIENAIREDAAHVLNEGGLIRMVTAGNWMNCCSFPGMANRGLQRPKPKKKKTQSCPHLKSNTIKYSAILSKCQKPRPVRFRIIISESRPL